MRQIVHALGGIDQKAVFFPQGLVARKDFVHLVVRHARARSDDRFGKARLVATSILVHLHQCGKGQTVNAGVQRTDAVAERKRQHRHDMARVINRCAAAERFHVERCAGRDIVRYVRNVHAEQQMTVFQRFERNSVVKVLRVIAVDCENQLVAQVKTALDRRRINLLPNRVRLLQYFIGKYVVYAVFVQDARDGGFHRAVLAQIRLDHALRRQLFIPVAGDGHCHAVAGLGVAQMVAVDGDFRVFFGGRLHKIGVSALHQRAGQLPVGAA